MGPMEPVEAGTVQVDGVPTGPVGAERAEGVLVGPAGPVGAVRP